MTQEEIIKIAKEYFDTNKALDKVFVTKDGNIFSKENLASKHNSLYVKDTVTTITRKSLFKTKKDSQITE